MCVSSLRNRNLARKHIRHASGNIETKPSAVRLEGVAAVKRDLMFACEGRNGATDVAGVVSCWGSLTLEAAGILCVGVAAQESEVG